MWRLCEREIKGGREGSIKGGKEGVERDGGGREGRER